MTVLLLGGSGQVGSLVAAEILSRSGRPRVLTRKAETLAELPTGVEGFVGDVEQPESLAPALAGVEAVFLLLANDPKETHQALTALAAIKQSGVRRLVYLSSRLSSEAPHVPHAGAKLAVEAAITRSDLAYTILQPTFFAQNDLMGREAILHAGIYPHPLGQHGVARVDTRDVASAAATALLSGKGAGARFPLSSPDAPSGPESAALWSEALGREVRYPGDDLQAWAKSVEGLLPAWFIYDLAMMYRHLQAAGEWLSDPELALQEELLGGPPRRYGDFVRETANAWLG